MDKPFKIGTVKQNKNDEPWFNNKQHLTESEQLNEAEYVDDLFKQYEALNSEFAKYTNDENDSCDDCSVYMHTTNQFKYWHKYNSLDVKPKTIKDPVVAKAKAFTSSHKLVYYDINAWMKHIKTIFDLYVEMRAKNGVLSYFTFNESARMLLTNQLVKFGLNIPKLYTLKPIVGNIVNHIFNKSDAKSNINENPNLDGIEFKTDNIDFHVQTANFSKINDRINGRVSCLYNIYENPNTTDYDLYAALTSLNSDLIRKLQSNGIYESDTDISMFESIVDHIQFVGKLDNKDEVNMYNKIYRTIYNIEDIDHQNKVQLKLTESLEAVGLNSFEIMSYLNDVVITDIDKNIKPINPLINKNRINAMAHYIKTLSASKFFSRMAEKDNLNFWA